MRQTLVTVGMLMNLIAVLTAALFLLSACNNSSPQNSFTPSEVTSTWMDGIIGGVPVAPTEDIAKSVALLLNSDLKKAICTVTILNFEYAITAAHCVELFRTGALLIAFGHEFRKTTPIRQVIMAATLPSRPGREAHIYDTRDMALVKFSGGLPAGYQPVVPLPYDYMYVLKPGVPVTLAGYGVDKYDPMIPSPNPRIDTLRKAELQIWNPLFSATEVMIDQRHGKAACKGDSGGPAFVSLGGKMYFWGIASRGTMEDGREPTDKECSQFVVYSKAIELLRGLATLKTSTR